MKKIIKINQKQLNEIVGNVISEQGADDISARRRLFTLLGKALSANKTGDTSSVNSVLRTAMEILYIYQGNLNVEIPNEKFDEMIKDNEPNS